MPSRRLDDLDPRFLPLACYFLARCVEAGIMVAIINTRRTDAEQAANLAAGVSWVSRSKHQDGLALDVAPFSQYALHGPDKLEWDANDPAWQIIGSIAGRIGLRWGGLWRVRDMGHVEMPAPWPINA